MDIHHDTLVFERRFDATPARLFRAYTDPEQRQIWSAPTPESVIIIDEADIRTGGQEKARCGSHDNLKWNVDIAYHLVKQDRLIVFTEKLWQGQSLLTVAQVTFDLLVTDEKGTDLTLTDQVTSFVGQGGVDGHREGYAKALSNLAASFARAV